MEKHLKALERLAERAFHHGGLDAMRVSIDRALAHIWKELEQ